MATIDDLNLTPYQRIMAQMTPAMNPYTGAGQVMGGYDPSFQGGYDPGLYSRLTRSGLINTGGGGMGGGGGGGGSDATTNPFSNMTQAERAAYYAANPTMASVTRGLQGLFGNTLYGKIQNYFDPNFVTEEGLIAMGVNPATYQAAKEGFRSLEQKADPEYYGFGPLGDQVFSPEVDTSLESQGAYSAPAGIDSDSGPSGGFDSGPAGIDSDSGPSGGFDSGSSGFGDYFKGGLVNSVGGSDPAGPDEGQINIMRGEYVVKKSAVKKYGQGLLDMINDGKIPAKKMKSLLG